MDILLDELTASLPDQRECIRITLRLLTAAILGAIIGLEREKTGKEAGMRTHMIVAMGAALLLVAPMEIEMGNEGLSRIIQGLVTGIGFLGAGTILKVRESREIKGMTTAAGIWMTCAIGIAAGMGRLWLAVIATIFTWIILYVLEAMSLRLEQKRRGAPRAE